MTAISLIPTVRNEVPVAKSPILMFSVSAIACVEFKGTAYTSNVITANINPYGRSKWIKIIKKAARVEIIIL